MAQTLAPPNPRDLPQFDREDHQACQCALAPGLGRAFQSTSISTAPNPENPIMLGPHAPQPLCSSSQPMPKPTNEPPTYCMPSNMPAAVAAARWPPKSIDAVPESIECTIEIASELTMNAMMTASRLGDFHTT